MFGFNMYVAIGIAVALVGSHAWVYRQGQMSVEVKIVKAEVKANEEYEEKTKEIIRLPITQLKRRYCEWMRDSKELCLQADIPIAQRQGN